MRLRSVGAGVEVPVAVAATVDTGVAVPGADGCVVVAVGWSLWWRYVAAGKFGAGSQLNRVGGQGVGCGGGQIELGG